jgi:hypothetical protein
VGFALPFGFFMIFEHLRTRARVSLRPNQKFSLLIGSAMGYGLK